MYLKPQTVRKPNGKCYTYYRLVESYRDNGQVRHRVLCELGRLQPEEARRLSRSFARAAGHNELVDPSREDLEIGGMRYFGAPLLVERIVALLRLDEWVEQALKKRRIKFDVMGIVKVMLCAHLFKSHSRAEWAVWEWQQKLFGIGHRFPDSKYPHFLRALSRLASVKDHVEQLLYPYLLTLFDLEVDLVFYDLTSTYVEGRADWSQLLKRGYSRDKRPGCKQVVVGLVVTREGFPVTFRVFEGNTLDFQTLRQMRADLQKRFSIARCIWVSDAGLLTKENRTLWERAGDEYVFAAGGGSGANKEIQKALTDTRSRTCHEVEGLGLWEVKLPDPPDGRRAIVVESDGRREKNAAIFERRLHRVREGFEALGGQVRAGRLTEAEDIRLKAEKVLHRCRVKKYFSYEYDAGVFRWEEDRKAVNVRKKEGGKYALLTNTALAPEEVVKAYRTLLVAEDCFRVLKDELDCRPLWHKSDANISGHVLLAVWSLLLYRTLEAQLQAKHVKLPTSRALEVVKEVKAVEVAVREGQPIWKLMKVPSDARQVFRALGLPDLKTVFKEWEQGAPAFHYERRCVREKALEALHDG